MSVHLSHSLLPPKTLAISSCVSKSWNSLLSSNHIWMPHLTSSHPSIANSTPSSSISPRHLYSLLRSPRHIKPCAPRIALKDLFFMVDVFQSNSPVLSFIVQGHDLAGKYQGPCGVFLFDVEVDGVEFGDGKEVRVVWNVVMEGWRGCFLMMDRSGPGRASGAWFMEELPAPGCCFRVKGGFVAEFGLRVEDCGVWKVSLGLMDAGEWRYLRVEHALLYLQNFLV